MLETHRNKGERALALRTPYVSDPTVFAINLDLIKKPLGTRWDKDARVWYAEGPEVIMDLERYGIQYTTVSNHVARDIGAFTETMERAIVARDAAREGMYGYQHVGSEYLRQAERAILADHMGLGKSKQAVDAIRRIWSEQGPQPTLVVALHTLTYNWQAEFTKWWPQAPVEVLPDAPKKRKAFWADMVWKWSSGSDDAPIVIANYEKLTLADFPEDFPFKILVADEATYIKNSRALRSKAFKRVADGASFVWLITGTPIEIRYEELYNMFSYIRPAIFGSFTRFRDAHLVSDFAGNIIGARDRETLTERVAPWIIRRTKDQVNLQLPPKLFNDVPVELTKEERDGYKTLLHDFDAWLAEREEDATTANTLTQLLRLQQYTSSPHLLDPDDRRGSKYEALRDLISEWDGQVLVFTRFSEMADRLREWLDLPERAIIKGAITSAQERLRRVDDFNAGALGQTLVSTDAGAHGLNVTAADMVVHYDQLWNPAKKRQREDRLHRIGQTKPVNVIDLTVPNTVDIGMFRVAASRQQMADELLDAADEFIVRQINYRKVARGEYAT